MSLIVAFPQVNSAVSDLQYTDYRLMINNQDTTNRNVKRSSPLAYDRIKRYFNNKSQSVRSLKEKNHNTDAVPSTATEATYYASDQNAILETLPITNGQKICSLEVNTDASHKVKELILFKEIIKTI